MTSEPNITRMDYARTHGWWVRFQRTQGGKMVCYSKFFSDGRNGGERFALRAARAWRASKAPTVPVPTRRNGPIVAPPGHGYVRRCLPRGDERNPVWSAWLRVEDRRCRRKSYSVAKWGERGAKRLADRWLARERRELGRRLRASARR